MRGLKRFIGILLVVSILTGMTGAFALTAEDVLGLNDSGSTGEVNAYTTLQVGSRDGDDAAPRVVMLQNRLISLGYLDSSADGQYGAGTESAVLAFQENNSLMPTGVADNITQTVLYSESAIRAPQRMVSDNSILHVQTMLVRMGFMIGNADGIAGDATRTAVAEFKEYVYNTYADQYSVNPRSEPTPGPEASTNDQPIAMDTLLALESDYTSASGYDGEITEDIEKYADGEYAFQTFQRMVQKGDSGAEVWRVQRRLCQLGYLYKADGAFGDLTRYAILYFQKRNGLKVSGAADRETQERLFSDNALGSSEYVFPYKIIVDISDQRVYIYGWDGDGFNKKVGSCKCSTGMSGYDTPTGTYQSGGKVTSGPWYYFQDYNCYAKYAYRVVGGIMFHSVLYNGNKVGPTNSSVNALGRKASHGCIRLPEKNAKWIFENCPEGTTIIIRS